MIRKTLQTLKDNPAAMLEDMVGMGAIVVMLMVALHIPVTI